MASLSRSVANPRRGLVFGGGGLLGFSWMVGALRTVEETFDFDARTVDLYVGTSAGAIMSALLGCGVSSGALLRHQQGVPLPTDPPLGWDHDTENSNTLRLRRPGWGIGSPQLAAQVARHPMSIPPIVALSAILPPGRGNLDSVATAVEGVSGERVWPSRPDLWIMAMNYNTGHRIPFGRTGSPVVALPQAVTASCSIPGWYPPVMIDGQRYVDGGPCSSTSIDLLQHAGLDEIYVFAPMASFALDQPRSMLARLERRYRRGVTRRLLREAAGVRASGARLLLLAPGVDDLQAMGVNVMDAARRLDVVDVALRSTHTALEQYVKEAGIR